MKNFLLTIALAIGSIIGAKAQSYFVVINRNTSNTGISANNFTFTTQQSGTTLTFSPPTGGYSSDYFMTAGYTANTPSVIAPAYLTITSGKTVKVHNYNTAAQKFAVEVGIVSTTTGSGITLLTGTAVTIAAGGDGTLTIPSYTNFAYTSAWPTIYGSYGGYPIVLTFAIVGQ